MSRPTQSEHPTDLPSQAREKAKHLAERSGEAATGAARYYVQEPAQDLYSLAKEYAKEKPDVVACWAFAAGFLIGWRLKP